MNKNYVLDLGNRHDIINTFERSFSSVLNKRPFIPAWNDRLGWNERNDK